MTDDNTPLNCERALAEVYTFLDGELTDEKRRHIASHLESCTTCFEAFDFQTELQMVISTKARDQVPETLRMRIAEKISYLRIDIGQNRPDDGHGLSQA
ncbi:MAG: mycothiol system anti-sigma-R factor [Actinomycetota bacterium]|jgi:mycothiol system anti-sigma-R factor